MLMITQWGIALSLVSCVLCLPACQDQLAKEAEKVIEYVEVKGRCQEDHVTQSTAYGGNLVHSFNESKNQQRVSGMVTNEEVETRSPAKNVKELAGTVARPYKYTPPYAVKFSELTTQQIGGNVFILKGISEHVAQPHQSSAQRTPPEGPKYEATCELTVTKRLDHVPSAKDRKKGRLN